MKCTVHYYDGRTDDEYDSIQAAMTALMDEYSNGVAADAGGWDVDAETTDEGYDVRSGRAALVWASAEDAGLGDGGLGDDGSHAVAQIIVEESD